jgi:hypothetical protein
VSREAHERSDHAPGRRRWSPFELLLIAVAVWIALMALAFVLPLFAIALGG